MSAALLSSASASSSLLAKLKGNILLHVLFALVNILSFLLLGITFNKLTTYASLWATGVAGSWLTLWHDVSAIPF